MTIYLFNLDYSMKDIYLQNKKSPSPIADKANYYES